MPLSFFCIAFALFSSRFSSIHARSTPVNPPHLFGPVARIVVSGQHICGASILSRDWVLTAAHCVTGSKYKETEIVVGDHRLSVLDEPEQTVKATQFIIHQDYDKSSQFHDIALILVYPAIEFSPKVTCVNTPVCRFSASDKHLLAGWGKHDFGSGEPSEELMEATVFVFPGENCKEKIPNIPDSKYVFCTESDTCAGDTGGPVFDETDRKSFTQTGVYSYSQGGCNGTGGVTVYTKISEYAEWIDRRTRGCGNFPFYQESS